MAEKTVFGELFQLVSRHEFNKCVERYQGNYGIRSFSCWDQFLCMAFAQLTGRDGLRDIEACLNSHRDKLYRMGFRGQISRSTLADANHNRTYLIYQDFGMHLIARARKLYQGDPLALELDNTVYALDSSTIDLCLSVFPWAHFRRTKAAVKMHTLLDLRGSIPSFIALSTGKMHDVRMLDVMPLEAGSIVTMDRAYNDFERLYTIHQIPAFFVIRAKSNLRCRRVKSHPIDKSTGLRADQFITLTGARTRELYPERLRRISYIDQTTNKRLVFLTNHVALPALTIAAIYKQRWQVELFFKWVKQHLRIKAFYGTSPNAVKTQIWIAISVYLLVAIAKKELDLPGSLHTILQIFEVNLFEKRTIKQIVSEALKQESDTPASNQLNLFDS